VFVVVSAASTVLRRVRACTAASPPCHMSHRRVTRLDIFAGFFHVGIGRVALVIPDRKWDELCEKC